jgi:hypothetical protein
MRNFVLLAALAAAVSGCTTKNNYVMSDTAYLRAESHQMWTRPVEMGYEVLGDIQGEASQKKILGITVGAEGGGSIPIFGALFGGAPTANAVVANAAYEAVVNNGADAIYITRYTQDKTGFLFLFKNTNAVVYGKALKLVNYGPVEEDRADKDRFEQPTEIRVKSGI